MSWFSQVKLDKDKISWGVEVIKDKIVCKQIYIHPQRASSVPASGVYEYLNWEYSLGKEPKTCCWDVYSYFLLLEASPPVFPSSISSTFPLSSFYLRWSLPLSLSITLIFFLCHSLPFIHLLPGSLFLPSLLSFNFDCISYGTRQKHQQWE